MAPLRIACDFDDVVHNPHDKEPGYRMGKPVAGAVNALNILKAKGCIIVIFCLWASQEPQKRAISEWCRYFNVPYDFITNIKPDVDWLIDNKGYHFENWADTLKFLGQNTDPGNE